MKKSAITLFWLLSVTWGLPATLAGAIFSLICLGRGLKPRSFHGNVYFEHVRPRGSNNLGPFFFLGNNATPFTKYHEAGHGLQNILLGPLFFLVVGIPSEIWYQHFTRKHARALVSGAWSEEARRAAYDAMPIERWASLWGEKMYASKE
ncbi:MAG: hypothetical protein LBB67_03715 [Oscillospiraceae bacterium]|jgi:hypothetical protein|nr:hypothetical protein [Oscillospiraceae bacterium]